MGDHGAEEYQQTQPNEGEGADEADDIDLGGNAEVGVDGYGNDQHGNGEQRVAAGHENVLEAAFALKQSGQTPVCQNEQEQGNQYAEDLRPDGSQGCEGIQQVALTDGLVVEGCDGQQDEEDRAADGASLLVLQIPEAIEGMENQVEAVGDLLTEGSLLTRGSHALVELGHPLEEQGDTHDQAHDDHDQEQEVGGHPLLTDLLVGVGPVIGVVGRLEVGEGVGIVLVTVHSILEKEAIAGKETVNSYYAKANTFATKTAGKYENFKKACEEENVYAHPVNKMLESTNRLGAIDNTKEVTRWAFEAKKGTASNIITVDNNYFIIAALKGIHEEGYTPVEEVASTIQATLYSEKLGEKKALEVAEKIEGLTSMEAVAEALGTTVSTKDGVAFGSDNVRALDPAFVGAASVAEEGKIYGPVTGGIGVYVYKVTGKETGAFFTEDDAKARNSQNIQYTTQMVLPVMMDDAGVEDNRARFY